MSGFVAGYENDIFVSYAWVDNKPIQGIDMGWVSHLVDTLENILAQTLGRADLFELWMDKKRESNTVRLTTEIVEKVERSATLLAVLSPGYIESQWCMKELDCFIAKMTTSPKGSLGRIFVVEKTGYGLVRPKALQDNIAYPFWYQDHNKRIRTLGLPQYRPEEVEYYYKIQDIVYDMIDVFKQLREERSPCPISFLAASMMFSSVMLMWIMSLLWALSMDGYQISFGCSRLL